MGDPVWSGENFNVESGSVRMIFCEHCGIEAIKIAACQQRDTLGALSGGGYKTVIRLLCARCFELVYGAIVIWQKDEESTKT